MHIRWPKTEVETCRQLELKTTKNQVVLWLIYNPYLAVYINTTGIAHIKIKNFYLVIEVPGSCICLKLDLYMPHVLVLCVSVIFSTCDMYKSSLRHIHDPVLPSQDRNYTCNIFFLLLSDFLRVSCSMSGCFISNVRFSRYCLMYSARDFFSILVSAILVMWNVNP